MNGYLRRLDDPKTGRAQVRPVDRTVILKRAEDALTLLGPSGADLALSLKDGPLGKAGIHGPEQVTTFSFTPDGKTLLFANAKDVLCRITLATKQLAVSETTGVDPGRGIQVSPDGARILYSKYHRKNDFETGVHQVYIAAANGTGEKKLTEYLDGTALGFGFQADGRVALAGPTTIRAFDPKSGKVETTAGPWKTPLKFRAFGGLNPDGSTFTYDLGGPYVLNLYAFDVKSKKVTTVKTRYLESFQQMVWVRVPEKQ